MGEVVDVEFREEGMQLARGPMFLRSRVSGRKGRPVILVHGLVVSGSYLMPLAEELCGWRDVYVPDLPCYGKSGKRREVPEAEDLAEAVVEMMDVLGIKEADFVGNSYGCQVLTEVAIRHPAKVGRMVFVGPSVDSQNRSVWVQFLRLLRTAIYEHPKLPPLVAYEYLKAGPRVVFATLRACFRHRVELRFPLVDAEVLVVRGSKDAIADQRWVEEVVMLLPRSGLLVMRGAGHAPNFSQASELAGIVREFLRDGD